MTHSYKQNLHDPIVASEANMASDMATDCEACVKDGDYCS
jgi:hypothetical protein